MHNERHSERVLTLTRMKSGQSGVVVRIDGGHGLVSRLGALGVRPGKRITNISSMIMRGPVTIKMDRTKIAIGFGMAKKVLVEVDRTKT